MTEPHRGRGGWRWAAVCVASPVMTTILALVCFRTHYFLWGVFAFWYAYLTVWTASVEWRLRKRARR